MYERLQEFSQFLPERPAWQRLNEGMHPPYDRGMALCFDEQGEWAGVATICDDRTVVYRSGPPNGTDFTPCCKLAGNTAKRLCLATKKLLKNAKLAIEQRTWLQRTIAVFQESLDAIWDEVETALKQLGINGLEHRGYVFWCLKTGSRLEAVYDWPEAKDFLVEQFLSPFSKGGKRSGTCIICGHVNVTVYGNFSVMACYNLDKPGSIAGGFRAEQAHRNLPVCETCALALAEAFNFADSRLKSNMGGQSYLLVPYAHHPGVRAQLKFCLKHYLDQFMLDKMHDLLADPWPLPNKFIDCEFAGCGDQLSFNLVFFKEEQAAWRIQAEVPHLLPSRIQELHAAGRQIAQAMDLAAERDEILQPLRITTQTFRNMAGTTGKASANTLRTWLVALFDRRAIDPHHFIRCLVDKLIAIGKVHPEYLNNSTRHAWGLYRYARLTGLIQNIFTLDPRMSKINPDSPYGRYLTTHRDFFSKPELSIAFLTGCYASIVASVQRQMRNTTPFTKKFLGRQLNREHLAQLYRECHGKLAQYGKLAFVIQTLDPDLAHAWVQLGDEWTVTNDTATFAFMIGYSLSYRIYHLDTHRTKSAEMAERVETTESVEIAETIDSE